MTRIYEDISWMDEIKPLVPYSVRLRRARKRLSWFVAGTMLWAGFVFLIVHWSEK